MRHILTFAVIMAAFPAFAADLPRSRIDLREQIERYAEDTCGMYIIDEVRDVHDAGYAAFERLDGCRGSVFVLVNETPTIDELVPIPERLEPFQATVNNIDLVFTVPSEEEGAVIVVVGYCPDNHEPWESGNDRVAFEGCGDTTWP